MVLEVVIVVVDDEGDDYDDEIKGVLAVVVIAH